MKLIKTKVLVVADENKHDGSQRDYQVQDEGSKPGSELASPLACSTFTGYKPSTKRVIIYPPSGFKFKGGKDT